MPVATRLSSRRVNMSGTLSWPAYRLWARIMSDRNTATGRPHRVVGLAHQHLARPLAVGVAVGVAWRRPCAPG